MAWLASPLFSIYGEAYRVEARGPVASGENVDHLDALVRTIQDQFDHTMECHVPPLEEGKITYDLLCARSLQLTSYHFNQPLKR